MIKDEKIFLKYLFYGEFDSELKFSFIMKLFKMAIY